MMLHPFEVLAPEYEKWIATVKPLPARVAEIDAVARRLTRPAALARLAIIKAKAGIPEVVQATIGERECGFDFSKNWGQGDPLTHPSTHVPRGRPPLGAPPNDHFPVSWEYAALDAFAIDHLDDASAPWSLVYGCWKWEGYNGFGYRSRGLRTPYVVGGTNLQQPGKFVADGRFLTEQNGRPLFDSQLGTLPIALRMIELVPSLAFGVVPTVTVRVPIDVTPVPVGVGGGPHDTSWVQDALNRLDKTDTPLLVDGNFGRRTREAVRAFQAAHGITTDGLAGPITTAALEKALLGTTQRG
jgi:lysozyme family protein